MQVIHIWGSNPCLPPIEDPQVRDLKRILLAAWFPDRVSELNEPEP